MANPPDSTETLPRPLYVIADDIRRHWPSPWFGAVPYLEAMGQCATIHDRYYADSAYSVVQYFLYNAAQWRGPDAKRVKTELRAMCKAYDRAMGRKA